MVPDYFASCHQLHLTNVSLNARFGYYEVELRVLAFVFVPMFLGRTKFTRLLYGVQSEKAAHRCLWWVL